MGIGKRSGVLVMSRVLSPDRERRADERLTLLLTTYKPFEVKWDAEIR